jgi:hypothetical protein
VVGLTALSMGEGQAGLRVGQAGMGWARGAICVQDLTHRPSWRSLALFKLKLYEDSFASSGCSVASATLKPNK